ncbi:hypothetical protein PR202_ga08588 [Eleusine coracana subsp. coracana]|uniref:Exocyst subunit Exo70 family protein n=1 Tax=Eleusine coracana subsp. coracana TaxID=191504 RepID=A0AAV5C2Y1_ELECO|nr:hypothetical protein PR202_ga08588 [Eleusine coracana subsp. coracana]
MCREVPDPALRAALRKAQSEMVVPAYTAFVQKHPRLEKATRYTAEDLTDCLSKIFRQLVERAKAAVSMGAAIGKASEHLTVAGEAETRAAAARLAFAEHAMLQWNRSPGADTGIWDADGNFTNSGLLAAVDEVLLLAKEDSSSSFPVRRHLDGAVALATSRMVEECLRVRVWDAAQLRFAVDRLALASSGASAMAFPSGAGDRTNSTSTGGGTSSSDGSQPRRVSLSWSVPEEIAALVDAEFLDEQLHLICPAGVSVLHEIAQRVVRADGTKEFLRAFANAPCDVLDRFLSILRVECSGRTTEVVIKRWSAVTKILEKAVPAMRRQLHAQPPGAFDSFRDEYLSTIAETRVLVLLQFADDFTTLTSHEKLVHILSMYDALSDAAPGLLLLFTGARKQLVTERTQDILTKLAGVIRTMVNGLMAKIQSDYSRTSSPVDGGVHPLTRYVTTRVEQELAPHRTVLGLILATSGDVNGAAERVTTFAGLVDELIEALERNLEKISALIFADAGDSAHLFLANNISFVLSRTDVASLLGDEWVTRRRSKLERHAASYVEVSWRPVVACLETSGKPARALAKFNAAFKEAHGSQVCSEVPDPAFRASLRKAVAEKVVPPYVAFLKKNPKLEKSVRYSADNLAESLADLFEGEATNA